MLVLVSVVVIEGWLVVVEAWPRELWNHGCRSMNINSGGGVGGDGGGGGGGGGAAA